MVGAVMHRCRVAAALACLVTLPAVPAQDDFEAAVGLLEQGASVRARSAFEALARAGDARAQDALAGMLVAGVGGSADREEAMSWYCVLAHQPGGGREVVHALWLLAEYFRTGFAGQQSHARRMIGMGMRRQNPSHGTV